MYWSFRMRDPSYTVGRAQLRPMVLTLTKLSPRTPARRAIKSPISYAVRIIMCTTCPLLIPKIQLSYDSVIIIMQIPHPRSYLWWRTGHWWSWPWWWRRSLWCWPHRVHCRFSFRKWPTILLMPCHFRLNVSPFPLCKPHAMTSIWPMSTYLPWSSYIYMYMLVLLPFSALCSVATEFLPTLTRDEQSINTMKLSSFNSSAKFSCANLDINWSTQARCNRNRSIPPI